MCPNLQERHKQHMAAQSLPAPKKTGALTVKILSTSIFLLLWEKLTVGLKEVRALSHRREGNKCG